MFSLHELEFLRAASVVPVVHIGDPEKNACEIIKYIKKAEKQGVDLLVFPELCVSGYTCGDIFLQDLLYTSCMSAIAEIKAATIGSDMLVFIGTPLDIGGRLYNTAVAVSGGSVKGIVPKVNIPNYSEFYEKRWFSEFFFDDEVEIDFLGEQVIVSPKTLFKHSDVGAVIACEICEDLYVPQPPSGIHAENGANVIVNLSASDELVGKGKYREALITAQSGRCATAYVYVSAGQSESTTDMLFGGHRVMAEGGYILSSKKFEEDCMSVQDIDITRLKTMRRRTDTLKSDFEWYNTVSFGGARNVKTLERDIYSHPFVPRKDSAEILSEIMTIQAQGLATRFKKTGIKSALIGISGGMDSTLAFLVTVESFKLLGRDLKDIIAVTMPGFGTTSRTKSSADNLMVHFGVTAMEIDIKESATLQLSDIDHDINTHDVTYENVQARQRTQILMNLANKHDGLVIGTGDLSELALGWATYNGDHMSMYGVNCSIPKTLVSYLIRNYKDSIATGELVKILEGVLDTPISPELLPPSADGEISQKTEEKIGVYDIHDFILYHMLRDGHPPKKIFALLTIAFSDTPKKKLKEQLALFYKRFFTHQFKRSVMPDGIKVGTVTLSPRGDFRMPSDMSYRLWLKEIEEIKI